MLHRLETELVYGVITRGSLGFDEAELVFIPQERAQELAIIHRALGSAPTWGELRDRLPPSAYDELLSVSGAAERPGFDEFYTEERESRPSLTRDDAVREYKALSTEERRPEPEDAFAAGDIGAICEGDWPGWTNQEMLGWVPGEIQERYGIFGDSRLNGDFLSFRAKDERELVAAFEQQGYACIRDDDLVRLASGYSV
jgi:hypothetical protein